MSGRHTTLRERRRLETQRVIQTHAVRLFTERGYDATAVTDVAEAAGVSPMTVYRHFPTKEDLVLVDQNGSLIAEHIAATPADQPLVRRIGTALVSSTATLRAGGREGSAASEGSASSEEAFLLARLQLMITTPALRARHLDNQYVLQRAIVEAIGSEAVSGEAVNREADSGEAAGTGADFHVQAAASACLAAVHTALVRWAEDDGRGALSDLIAEALTAAFGFDFADTTAASAAADNTAAPDADAGSDNDADNGSYGDPRNGIRTDPTGNR